MGEIWFAFLPFCLCWCCHQQNLSSKTVISRFTDVKLTQALIVRIKMEVLVGDNTNKGGAGDSSRQNEGKAVTYQSEEILRSAKNDNRN